MLPLNLTPEFQIQDTAKEILGRHSGGTLSGMFYANEYRKLNILSFNERMLVAGLIETEVLCVGYDKDGELEIIMK